jgi:hypothetical protein
LGAAGGGNGTSLNNPSLSAIANTGSGGGGTGTNASALQATTGGAGGSGIVVLRYPSYLEPAATTGSPQTYIAGPYRVYVFTSSGSITF